LIALLAAVTLDNAAIVLVLVTPFVEKGAYGIEGYVGACGPPHGRQDAACPLAEEIALRRARVGRICRHVDTPSDPA
jgi:hypothetical protein